MDTGVRADPAIVPYGTQSELALAIAAVLRNRHVPRAAYPNCFGSPGLLFSSDAPDWCIEFSILRMPGKIVIKSALCVRGRARVDVLVVRYGTTLVYPDACDDDTIVRDAAAQFWRRAGLAQ